MEDTRDDYVATKQNGVKAKPKATSTAKHFYDAFGAEVSVKQEAEKYETDDLLIEHQLKIEPTVLQEYLSSVAYAKEMDVGLDLGSSAKGLASSTLTSGQHSPTGVSNEEDEDEVPDWVLLEPPPSCEERRLRSPSQETAADAPAPTFPPSPVLFQETPAHAPAPALPPSPVLSRETSPVPIPDLLDLFDDDEISKIFYYGSEESDSSDDEDIVVPALVPRTFRVMLDTPEDDVDSGSTDDIDQESTYLSDDFYKFYWTSLPIHPISRELRRETFSYNGVGPTSPSVDSYETFVAIWDRPIMEHIVTETNKYARQLVLRVMHNQKFDPGSLICSWYDTTVDELYTFFAVILAMGIVVKTTLQEYWSAVNDIFITPGFRAHMSLRRFQLLAKCLHFNDNENMCAQELDASEAKLFKIIPIVTHLNRKFQSMYNMNQNITLDESLLQWKGWLNINRSLPNKAAAVEIKTYEVCESLTRYLWRFEVCADKEPSAQKTTDPCDADTPAIVLRLMKGLEHKGHTLWMDHHYNSPALARKLKTLGFDCVGTFRTNQPFVPSELTNLTKSAMRPGQITGFTSGDVDLMVWRAQNRVAMISTYHGLENTLAMA